jgi:hypothetical protein
MVAKENKDFYFTFFNPSRHPFCSRTLNLRRAQGFGLLSGPRIGRAAMLRRRNGRPHGSMALLFGW